MWSQGSVIERFHSIHVGYEENHEILAITLFYVGAGFWTILMVVVGLAWCCKE